jgi:hypothetical protein
MKSLELFITFFIAGYNLMSLPFNSFIITLVIATIAFMATKSLLFTASVLIVPQLIRLMNTLLLSKKETFIPTNPQEVINSVKQFKEAKPTEAFNNPTEIIDRVSSLEKEEDKDDELEGTTDSLKFLEQFENLTGVSENQRIHTVNETAVPAIPTIINKNRPTAAVEPFDNTSLNTALIKSTNSNKPVSSNINSIEI